ncbi:MAG: hypothetical protein DKINENOH_02016 [bacterium]|nr:hypothetical protein [bacterium]
MYRSLQLLREHPFKPVPDPRYFYAASSHRQAFQRLLDTIEHRHRLFLLTGAAGAGKTLLIHALRRRLPANLATVLLLQTRLGEKRLFRRIAAACGLPALPHATPADELRQLHDFLRSPRSGLAASSIPSAAVVIIDDAHHLPRHTLDEIGVLVELAKTQRKPLQLILAGAASLLHAFPGVEPWPDHSTRACSTHLLSLDSAETAAYIAHRLRVAGYYDGEQLFTVAALRAVHEQSEGNPRRINALCSRALALAGREGLTSIARELVQEAARTASHEGEAEACAGALAEQQGERWQPVTASALAVENGMPPAGTRHAAGAGLRQPGWQGENVRVRWDQAVIDRAVRVATSPLRPPPAASGWRVWQRWAAGVHRWQQEALRKWLAPLRQHPRRLAMLLVMVLNLIMLMLILRRLW